MIVHVLRGSSALNALVIEGKFNYWEENSVKDYRGIALHGNPSQSYGASLAIWDHMPPDTNERTPP